MAKTYGIDVSHWQGNINWQLVHSTGQVKFAILKATESTWYVDTKFNQNKVACQNLGIPWGAYHFFRPEVDPCVQARLFKNAVGSGCKVYVLDLEATGANLVNRVAAFMNEMDALGVSNTMIYTGYYFWNTNMVPNPEWARLHDLWIAHYGVSEPTLPRGWTTYKIHQFSSKGTIAGISGNVDQNWFNGDEAAMRNYFKNGGVPVPPGPVTKIKVNINALNIRKAPVVSASTLLGYTTYGKVWEIEDTVQDASGRVWYKVGKAAYLAGWLCVPV